MVDTWNGRGIKAPSPDTITETDVSKIGWGAFCKGTRTGGLWSTSPHQLPRSSSGRVCSEIIREGAVQHTCSSKDGQPDGCHLYQQDGWHPFSDTDAASLPVVVVVPSQRNNTVCSQCPEQCGTQGITISSDLCRVETELQRVQRCAEDPRSCTVDLLATHLNHQLPRYVSWRPVMATSVSLRPVGPQSVEIVNLPM